MSDTKSSVFLENFVQQLHGNKELLRFLSDQWNKTDTSLRRPLKPTEFLSPKRELTHIHFSWFLSYLSTLPKESVQPFLSVMTPTQAQGISKQLGVPVKPVKLPYCSRLFLLSVLKKELKIKPSYPDYLLPPTPLSSLLDISWKHLIYLVDFLSVYDLVYEMKQIIDKKQILQIKDSLTKDQQKFFDFASKTPVKWYPPKLGLATWNGSKQALRSLLHQRGLKRLAYGIKHLDELTKWHLIHRLDVGRAKVIQQGLKEKIDEKVLPLFAQQVEKVLEIINK
jgi:hypothetical protein